LLGQVSYSIDVVPASAGGGKYGYVAPVNIMELPHLPLKVPFEGMNERGLTVSMLEFSESVYEKRDSEVEAVESLRVVHKLLANCDSVESALQYLESVRVVGLPGIPGLHWAITDPSGRSVVVEYLQGQRVVSENTPRVMTNDPNLQWHWRNLNTYSNLNPAFPHQNDFLQVETDHGVGSVPRAVGHGWNLFGLPGDTSPPSRFVRMFYLRGYALHTARPENASDAIVLGSGLLNNVFISFGTVPPDPMSHGDRPEYTPYAVLKSPQERKMLVRGYRNLQWRLIDLAKLDLSVAQSWPLEDGSLGIQDITAAGVPSTVV